MIDLSERTRRISGSRLLEILQSYDAKSVIDPFMGYPAHLNFLKRHGIAVHGGDLIDWFVRAGEGLVVNDLTILRDSEVAEIVEMLPGRIYPMDLFKGWDGVFFTEEQCIYLGVWHSNVHNLRSDGQTGLAIAGLWHVLCYWLQKSKYPDDMADLPPSELAWNYIRETEHLVTQNAQRNTVRRGDFTATLGSIQADAVFIAPPGRNAHKKADARVWMWEAWWQGDPYLNIERYYRDTIFVQRTNEDSSYDRALGAVFSAAESSPLLVLQTTLQNAAHFKTVMSEFRPHIEIISPHADETYVVGRR